MSTGKQPSSSRAGNGIAGFTLIELMIVVVIVGILASIAYPSFLRQIERTRRADGQTALLQAAQQLERCFTRFNSYAAAGCQVAADLAGGVASVDGWYVVTDENPGAATFRLVATPQGNQAGDTRCGELSLTHQGARAASGTAPDTCW